MKQLFDLNWYYSNLMQNKICDMHHKVRKMRQETPGVTTVAIIHYKVKGALSSLRQFFGNWKPFISPQKLFSFSRYLSFCLDFLVK